MTPRRIIAEWLRDSAVGFLLFVGGVTLSDLLVPAFGWQWAPVQAAGLFPFFWFANPKESD